MSSIDATPSEGRSRYSVDEWQSFAGQSLALGALIAGFTKRGRPKSTPLTISTGLVQQLRTKSKYNNRQCDAMSEYYLTPEGQSEYANRWSFQGSTSTTAVGAGNGSSVSGFGSSIDRAPSTEEFLTTQWAGFREATTLVLKMHVGDIRQIAVHRGGDGSKQGTGFTAKNVKYLIEFMNTEAGRQSGCYPWVNDWKHISDYFTTPAGELEGLRQTARKLPEDMSSKSRRLSALTAVPHRPVGLPRSDGSYPVNYDPAMLPSASIQNDPSLHDCDHSEAYNFAYSCAQAGL